MRQTLAAPIVRTSLVALTLAIPAAESAAQSAICDIVRPGDTVSSVASRLTGRPDSRHQPWFRIIDRTRSRVIPRAQYNRIQAGWHVCVPATHFARRVVPLHPPSTAIVATAPWIAIQRPRDRTLEVLLLFLGPAVFGAAMGFGWESVERFLTKREAVKREMRGFGEQFVRDFERPLVAESSTTRPIRSHLRYAPSDGRLDILLAPAAGRRYPNLDDHRRNVEYDVDRITERLKHDAFVRRPLRSEGEWVVIPFQLKARPTSGAVL